MENIDIREFEIVFRQQYSPLYMLALHYLQDGEAAKDVVSDAFMVAWNKRNNIDMHKIDSYLHICVRNKCLTLLKQKTPNIDLAASFADAFADDDLEEWRIYEKRLAEIEHIIQSLPPRSRHVLEQCYYNHLTYRQVAEEMGITTAGVKKHITKSLALLRAHFNIIKGY